MRFPKLSQWKQIFKVLKGTERTFFLVLVALAFLSAIYFVSIFYLNNTKIIPSYGGAYAEGVVGQPRFINPVYGEANDIDRTLIGLIYSGLLTYDKNGKIVNDLAESYEILDNGRKYIFELKDNLYWQDGIPLTVEDIIFTIKTIQNSDYKSPLRANWLDVGIEKISEKSLAISLNSPYNSFLENCTLKIIPQHIWKNVLPENFALSAYNLKPIGSGPYSFSEIQEANDSGVKSITLEANKKYFERMPYISEISFHFFNNKNELVKAINQKKIDGFALSYLDDNGLAAEKQIKQGWTENEKFNVYSFSLPRYFAIFFNGENSKIMADINITRALNYAVNKQELVDKVSDSYKDKISMVNSPIMPSYFGYGEPEVSYAYDLTAANTYLDKSGYKDQGDGQRFKANEKKPAFQFKTYLKQGSKSNEVAELQSCLARLDAEFKGLLEGETSGTYGKKTDEAVTAFQKKYMPDVKPTGEVGGGTQKKLNEHCLTPQKDSFRLELSLTTINQPQLVMVANLVKEYWEKAGVAVNIKTVELSELKSIIKNRDYEALLYGQALGNLPDLYPFWHSTQINDPGLNLSQYQNKKVDQLLKEARETLDEEAKAQKYNQMQDLILSDSPAIFLYNPDYLYWSSKKVKGIEVTKIADPSKRFEDIQNWYINTKRVWK